MRAVVLATVALVGCRVRFDDVPDARPGDARDDASEDAPACAFALCDRFDDDVDMSWDMKTMSGTGGFTVTNGQLVVTLAATGDDVFLVENLPAPTTSVTIGMKIGWATSNVGTNCELDLVALNWDTGTCGVPFGYYLVRDGTNPFNLQETNGNATCTGNRNNYKSVLDNTGLHDVKLTITVGTPGHVKLELDSAIIHDAPVLQTVPSTPFTLKLGGVIVRNAAAPWTITYDDVYVDID